MQSGSTLGIFKIQFHYDLIKFFKNTFLLQISTIQCHSQSHHYELHFVFVDFSKHILNDKTILYVKIN